MSILRSAVLIATLLISFGAYASELDRTIARLEGELGARIGVAVLDSGTGQGWTHRPDERFLLNSTVKVLLCAAILSRDDLDPAEALPVRADDILDYAPVTKRHVGGTMTIADLCLAAIDQSDNTATNILFGRLGGPAQLTAFLRGIGDGITRSDRIEPGLNAFVSGDPRDTTTPAAMARTLELLLTGNALSPDARSQLISWMRPGGVTGALIRPAVPTGWDVADKSGSGDHNRNLIAMLTPPGGAPIFVSLSISDTNADFATRNAALIELSAAVMKMLIAG